LPRIAYGSVPDDEYRAYQDRRMKLNDKENPEEDDVFWPKIQDQLYRLVDEILPLKASTPAGLAVQAKAVACAASDLWEGDGEPQHERLFIEAACAFCNITPWPIAQCQLTAERDT
jgi:hypothetical protein